LSHAAIMAMPMNAELGEAKLDEAALVAASRNGDGEAFGELVRRHQQRVFRLAGRFFRRPEEVEDVAQETFLQAWRKLDTYRARAPFEHWLTRVCLNCCYGRFRKRREDSVPLEYDIPSTPGDPTARLEVERLLGRLSGEDRFLLLLLHGEGWSVAEISRRLGWSRANVKVRAHRARKKLRGLLAEDSV
jgi:RNA polymerase sigma-70 factor (ECF subfamily)